ncbi:hypothetical protein LTR37_021357 [Vermiconidia calcicola]|uniref:Uncharacterized protein n=1 Tax=Vermiconidia calcicola TaxID=1690605 RepID=A0ACC3M8S7_9PEZI|nr:hypothetical protein LTR37_021357 [Vermiconidia calcicola]
MANILGVLTLILAAWGIYSADKDLTSPWIHMDGMCSKFDKTIELYLSGIPDLYRFRGIALMTQNKIYNQCIVGVENSTDRTDDTDQTLCLESQTAVLWRTGNLLRNIDYVEETLANSLDLNGTLCDLGINRYMYLRAKEDDQALVRSSVSL